MGPLNFVLPIAGVLARSTSDVSIRQKRYAKFDGEYCRLENFPKTEFSDFSTSNCTSLANNDFVSGTICTYDCPDNTGFSDMVVGDSGTHAIACVCDHYYLTDQAFRCRWVFQGTHADNTKMCGKKVYRNLFLQNKEQIDYVHSNRQEVEDAIKADITLVVNVVDDLLEIHEPALEELYNDVQSNIDSRKVSDSAMEQKLIYAELEVAANLTHEVLLSELALNDFTRDLYQDLEVEIVEKLSIWNGTLQTFVNDKLAEIISTNTNTNFDAKKTAVQTSVDAYKAAAVGAIKLLVDTAETSNNAALLVKIGAVEPDLTTTLTTNFATLTGGVITATVYESGAAESTPVAVTVDSGYMPDPLFCISNEQVRYWNNVKLVGVAITLDLLRDGGNGIDDIPTADDPDTELNPDEPGLDKAPYWALTPDVCMQLCLDEVTCVAFEYDTAVNIVEDTDRCTLYSSAYSISSLKNGWVSGMRCSHAFHGEYIGTTFESDGRYPEDYIPADSVLFEDAFVILKSEFETEVDAINDAFHAPAAADISAQTSCMETQVERADLLVKLMNFYDISNTIWEGRSAMGYDYIQSAITARIVDHSVDDDDSAIYDVEIPRISTTVTASGYRFFTNAPIQGPATHAVAISTCESNGMKLATPRDDTELAEVTARSGFVSMWTSINDKTTANTFVDVFELTPTFLPWATDEPEAVTADSTNVEQCVAFDNITPLTPFQSVTCDSSHEFICYGHQIDGAQTETLTAETDYTQYNLEQLIDPVKLAEHATAANDWTDENIKSVKDNLSVKLAEAELELNRENELARYDAINKAELYTDDIQRQIENELSVKILAERDHISGIITTSQAEMQVRLDKVNGTVAGILEQSDLEYDQKLSATIEDFRNQVDSKNETLHENFNVLSNRYSNEIDFHGSHTQAEIRYLKSALATKIDKLVKMVQAEMARSLKLANYVRASVHAN